MLKGQCGGTCHPIIPALEKNQKDIAFEVNLGCRLTRLLNLRSARETWHPLSKNNQAKPKNKNKYLGYNYLEVSKTKQYNEEQ